MNIFIGLKFEWKSLLFLRTQRNIDTFCLLPIHITALPTHKGTPQPQILGVISIRVLVFPWKQSGLWYWPNSNK